MITCINQGPYGPSFSKLNVSEERERGERMASFCVDSHNGGEVTVILDKKNTVILARKLLAWAGESIEVPPSVTGDLP